MTEPLEDRIARLISEGMRIVPAYTPRRGSFNSMPSSYSERNPGNWRTEVCSVLDEQLLTTLGPSRSDMFRLIEVVNVWLDVRPTSLRYERWNGAEVLVPTATMQTILSYAVFEMLVRRLLGDHRKHSSFDSLMKYFSKNGPIRGLSGDMDSLDDSIGIYKRLAIGRNTLMHGNVLRAHESEGELIALLVDLVALHVMQSELALVNDANESG